VAITLGPLGAAALPAVLVTFALDLAVLGGVWLALRPGRADIRSKDDLDRLRRGGRPVVVELYSNFCLICMSNRQTIKLAAMRVGAAAQFVRLELPTKAGSAIGEAYGARYTPSYLVFDEHGDLVRTIVPDNVTPLANGYRVLDDQGAVVSRAQRVTPELLVGLVRQAA
jgi:thiol:disulfide interchange protein